MLSVYELFLKCCSSASYESTAFFNGSSSSSSAAMSFFGKIKSAVMGNPVTRDYEVGKQVASAGPGLMWKVHQAVKKSTRQVRGGWG